MAACVGMSEGNLRGVGLSLHPSVVPGIEHGYFGFHSKHLYLLSHSATLGIHFISIQYSPCTKRNTQRAGEVAQQIGVLATKLDDVSSSPGSHLGEERTSSSSKLSSDLHKCAVCTHTHTHKCKHIVKGMAEKMFTAVPVSCVKVRSGAGVQLGVTVLAGPCKALGHHTPRTAKTKDET